MSYINPITCDNTWLSFEDLVRLIAGSGYVKTYGDIGLRWITLEDGSERWRIGLSDSGTFRVDNYFGGAWVTVYEI